ncbi:two-component system OmpR family sensor kinase [Sulfurirhabdus autotrophica]|uniref:histidine kinase n=2 Tax=Sulfurirhabdus autotrophica TaxID=1706046 RepID=A0A4R3Y4P6_9PROT|nr:two-component system OmpR family sensor kinase [Sulfurirhabdus autotrophica]
MLGSAILLTGLIAATASFFLAYSEAKEFQDDMLRQIAMLNQSITADTRLQNQQKIASEILLSDPESRVVVIHIPGDRRPDWLAANLSSGFHTLSTTSEQLRVYVRDSSTGKRTVVAQPTDARNEIAIDSALRTLIPLLLLLPLLVWLVVWIVRTELAPITRLSRSLDEQSADRPQPIDDNSLPSEITPFVHAINRLLDRVNNLMGNQRRFIADAAHELRSPLTALSIQAQNLVKTGSLNEMRERVAPLQEGIERARQLTEQLLNLARTQAGIPGENKINVSEVARELIVEHLPFAEAKHIDLGLEEMAPLSITGAPDALRLMLKNALENALKYTHEDGEVTLRLLSDNGCPVIEVVDNGPGIPVSERERVFDSFYRITGTSGEGNGLGLAIAWEAAVRLGGNLSLHERKGGNGLVFRYAHRCAK